MLAFLLQITALLDRGRLYLFALFMIWIWLLWLLRVVLAAQYRPFDGTFTGTTSVVIPVVDEDPELFADVLGRIVMSRPDEVVVVINGPRNPRLEAVCQRMGVRWAWTETPGKRNALRIGFGLTTGDVVVLVDSDTLWMSTTLSELVKPFADPRVGGVTTRQAIMHPGRNVLTRWADWLESVRCEYSLPAMSVLGTVGCLPGRTIAFRRAVIERNLERFLGERFLGVFLEVSDDRTLTNYALMDGYRTVYQSTSLVYTDAPTNLFKLIRQQYRWARGSQYNTLRMLGWMLRNAPVLAVFYLSDIVVPFVLVGTFASWGASMVYGHELELYEVLPLPDDSALALLAILGLSLLMTTLSAGVRFGRHFAYRPGDIAYLPIFMLINTFLLMPIRVVGFFRMAHNAGWGTRVGGFAGSRSFNAQGLVPYVVGGVMLTASVMVGV